MDLATEVEAVLSNPAFNNRDLRKLTKRIEPTVREKFAAITTMDELQAFVHNDRIAIVLASGLTFHSVRLVKRLQAMHPIKVTLQERQHIHQHMVFSLLDERISFNSFKPGSHNYEYTHEVITLGRSLHALCTHGVIEWSVEARGSRVTVPIPKANIPLLAAYYDLTGILP